MGNESPGKRREYHPSVESDEQIEAARAISETVLADLSDDDVAEDLLAICREMTIGQLAYALLNLHKATTSFPVRDHAVALAFNEKYSSRSVH